MHEDGEIHHDAVRRIRAEQSVAPPAPHVEAQSPHSEAAASHRETRQRLADHRGAPPVRPGAEARAQAAASESAQSAARLARAAPTALPDQGRFGVVF